MTPAERAQAGALVAQAEAMREQAAALTHLAEAQIRAVTALLGAAPPSGDATAAAEKIFGEPEPRKYFGTHGRSAAPGGTQ